MTDETGTEQETAANGAGTEQDGSRRKRGQPSLLAESELDVKLAIDDLVKAHVLYLAALGDADARERRQLETNAREHITLTLRLLGEVMKRRVA